MRAQGRPAIGNTAPSTNNYGGATEEPMFKVTNGKPIIVRSKGFDFVVDEDVVSIYSVNQGRNVLTITSAEILIGNPAKEHIRIPL